MRTLVAEVAEEHERQNLMGISLCSEIGTHHYGKCMHLYPCNPRYFELHLWLCLHAATFNPNKVS